MKTLYYPKGEHAVILFHGYTSDDRDFVGIRRPLLEEGYTVYTPIFSGHGTDNPSDILSYSIEDWVVNGKEAVSFIKEKGHKTISVFGLSLGGVVATSLAMMDTSLSVFGTFSSPIMPDSTNEIGQVFYEWFKTEKQKKGMDLTQATLEANKAIYKMNQMMIDMNQFKQGLYPNYERYTGSVFIGQGAKDKIINPHQAKNFSDTLQRARVTFKWYEEGGHVITIGETGRELRQDLVDFLNQCHLSADDT